MSSQLNVDTIVDKAGSGGTNVKIGNTSTYVSDGGGATQNTVQGLAKAWAMNNQVTTHSNTDSFNISGITDVKTGGTTETFTNNMASQGYSGTFCSGFTTIDDASLYAVKYNAPNSNIATTGISFTWYYGSHGTTSKQAADCSHIGMTITGDLA